MKEIKLTRYEKNPIMTAGENSWENLNVSNSGAVVHNDKVYLLYRAEGEARRKGPNSWPITYIGLAESENGFDISKRYSTPVFGPDDSDIWNKYGCEDPRISKIGDVYYIVYTAMSDYGDHGGWLMWATTKDFVTYEKHGALMPEMEQRTSGLLPQKINGRYFLFHRPMPNMWGSYTKDFKSWEEMTCIFRTKPGTWYENKLGIGPAPIETEHGWLLFWHGKNNKSEYALGIMLLDKNDPRKIIKIQDSPILECEMEYEKKGFLNNVVYTNGAVRFQGKYFVYYGCCDHCLSVATISEQEIDEWCKC